MTPVGFGNPFLTSQMLDAIQEGVIVYGSDSRYEIWNRAMERMTGISEGEVLGHLPHEMFPIVENSGVLENIGRALDGETPDPLTFRWEHPESNRSGWVVSRISPLVDRDGTIYGALATVVDISERMRVQKERDEISFKLREAQKMEALGSLAGGVAHDLNNVLGAVLGMASSRRSTLPEESDDGLARALDTIIQASIRGREVVKSLLYFAHKAIGGAKPVDLNSVSQELVDLLTHATYARVEIKTDLAENLARVAGDSVGLSHALMNVCVNAIESMPDGGTLTVTTKQLTPYKVALLVQDDGGGMTPEVKARCMEPFFTTKPKGEGTGLGLSMVFGAVKAHEGTIDIESEPGRGTEIRIVLPCIVEAPRVEPVAPAETHIDETQTPLNVLVVDDDVLVAGTLAALLEVMGHSVTITHRGTAALAKIDGGLNPDLILLDLSMPGMSGAEVLVEVLKRRPSQPVLLVSGYSEDDMKALCTGGTYVGYLVKPFTKNELGARISRLLRGERSERKQLGDLAVTPSAPGANG